MPRNVAIGVGLMEFPFAGIAGFWRWVDLCEAGGIDSLWQSNKVGRGRVTISRSGLGCPRPRCQAAGPVSPRSRRPRWCQHPDAEDDRATADPDGSGWRRASPDQRTPSGPAVLCTAHQGLTNFSTNSSFGCGGSGVFLSLGSLGLRRNFPSSTSLKPAASTSWRRKASSIRCRVPDSDMPVPGRPA